MVDVHPFHVCGSGLIAHDFVLPVLVLQIVFYRYRYCRHITHQVCFFPTQCKRRKNMALALYSPPRRALCSANVCLWAGPAVYAL